MSVILEQAIAEEQSAAAELLATRADAHRFAKLLNAQRLLRDDEPERRRFSFDQILWKAKKAWHGAKLGQPDRSGSSHSLAFSVEAPKEKLAFHVILNAY